MTHALEKFQSQPVYLAAAQSRPDNVPALVLSAESRTLENVVVARAGEGEGHGLFADAEFLQQVVALGNAAPGGLKSRFGHPDTFSDAIGTAFAFLDSFRLAGDTVLANLHLYEAARSLPGLAGANVLSWLLGDGTPNNPGFAAEAPEKLGLSVAFHHDLGAMRKFIVDHTDAAGDFISPDPGNPENLPHWRIAELLAADLVDRAALNPRHGLLSALASALKTTGNPPTNNQKGENTTMPPTETNLAAVTLDELSTGNPSLLASIRDKASTDAASKERGRCRLIFAALSALIGQVGNPAELIKKAGALIADGTEARLSDPNNPETLAGEAVSELKLLAANEITRGNAPNPGSNLAAETPGAPQNTAAPVVDPLIDGGVSHLAAARLFAAQNNVSLTDALKITDPPRLPREARN